MTKRSMKTASKITAPKTKAASAPAAPSGEPNKVAKTQLIEQVAAQAGLTKKQASEAVNATLAVIAEGIRSGKSVGLPGLGTFSVKATAARTGVRPGTSEKIQIAAGKKVAFKVATDLKSNL